MKVSTDSDSDWGGHVDFWKRCRRGPKGGDFHHHGGVMLYWNKTQSRVALSSADVELHGAVKEISEATGAQNAPCEICPED